MSLDFFRNSLPFLASSIFRILKIILSKIGVNRKFLKLEGHFKLFSNASGPGLSGYIFNYITYELRKLVSSRLDIDYFLTYSVSGLLSNSDCAPKTVI